MQLFVKHLSGSNETAIGLAHAGLVAIMQHQRMIKAVLQARAWPEQHTASGFVWRLVCTSVLLCMLEACDRRWVAMSVTAA